MTETASARTPSTVRQFTMATLLAVMLAVLLTLGFWQLQRRAWKLDLIAAVDRRTHAPPAPAPGPDAWNRISTVGDAYRKVRARGVFLNDREILVQAVTVRGPGVWVMTPLKTDLGFTILVNRGFAPLEQRAASARAAGSVFGETTVTGLLRISEPRGGFLRRNDPAAARWYSRDVAAMARAEGLRDVAPYFIDADATPNAGGWPAGGMTVISFPNNHLVYAITWFGIAAMLAGWAAYEAYGVRRKDRAT